MEAPQSSSLKEEKEEVESSFATGETPTRAPTKSDYCVHHVTMDDSLNTLVIRYGVSKDVIRFANDMWGPVPIRIFSPPNSTNGNLLYALTLLGHI